MNSNTMSEENDADDELDGMELILLPLTDQQPTAEQNGGQALPSSNGESHSSDETGYVGEKEEQTIQLSKPSLPVHIMKRKRSIGINCMPQVQGVKKHWKLAIARVMSINDPWEKQHLEECPTEMAVRHRYNAIRKEWVTDKIMVKLQNKRFNRGAMRECFRMKKLVNGKVRGPVNYVAKKYIEDVDRETYFEDVRLQMDAKLWAEEYNRHNPPKKVDIMQMCVVEFGDQDGRPLYHVEHYIEGDYVKYNSNSGFVYGGGKEEAMRATPQALSHFTFERSGHQLIVVDVQGVGDLYTDPQIHTADGHCYGDGNLGAKGMALFFHSHACNKICHTMHLMPFDLSQRERIDLKKAFPIRQNSMDTIIRPACAINQCDSPSPTERRDLSVLLKRTRHRTHSGSTSSSTTSDGTSPPDICIEDMSISPPLSPTDRLRQLSGGSAFLRTRSDSESDTITQEEERVKLMETRRHRPSTVEHELNLRAIGETDNVTGGSVLGQIHLEISKYHELGRFRQNPTEDENMRNDNGNGKKPVEVDWDSAAYHLHQAARCGEMEAILTLARIYLQLPHDILQGLTVKENTDNLEQGVAYMLTAAKAGDRASMLYMASAYHTGVGLGNRKKDWTEAIHWYSCAAGRQSDDESGMYDSTGDSPGYILLAKQAEIYVQGVNRLRKNPRLAGDLYTQAAEEATEYMKGKLANKYYMLAEEAWAEIVEEEDEEEEETVEE